MTSVRSVLLDLEGFGRWFPSTAEWRVLERGAGEAVVYGRQALPWPVQDRDYVVRYRWRDEPEGDFVLEATSVTGIGPDPPDGVVRAVAVWSRWRLRAGEGGRTDVHYHYRGDQGGRLPDWVAQAGWESQTWRVIQGLADEVARVGADEPL